MAAVTISTVSDSVPVVDAIFPLLGIGVSDVGTIAVIDRLRTITVAENVVLSFLRRTGDTVTVTDNGQAISIVTASTLLPTGFDIVTPDDNGQGVALQGNPGALILVQVVDNVALSKLIQASETVTVTDNGISLSFVSVGIIIIQRSDDITVTEQAWLAPYDSIPVSESVALYFRTLVPLGSTTVTVDDSAVQVLVKNATPFGALLIVKDESVLVNEGAGAPSIPTAPSVFDVVFISGLDLQVNIPLLPSKAETVTVDDTTIRAFAPFLAPTVSEAVTVGENAPLQFSVLFIAAGEDVSLVASGRISRPTQPWEAAAEIDDSWETSSAASDTWKAGAVEETVWA